MKNILTSLIFSLSCFIVNAQQNRFIYLQTENRQPFFVKFDNKILNSYPLGYLIIPKLDDGLYSLVIGFPESSNEHEFNCSINNKDVGFIIKNAGEKEWQLLNVQTLNVIIPGDVITKPVIAYEKETDSFSTMLANAVHDSTILRKDVAKEIFPEKSIEQNQKDSASTIATNNNLAISIPDNTLMSNSGKKDVAVKPDLRYDSSKKDIAIQTLPEKAIEQNQKDTANTIVSNSDVTMSKPDNTLKGDSGKKEITIQTPSQKSENVNKKDTAETIVSNDVATIKSEQKKKSMKNNNALQDSVMAQKEVVKTISEKINENKDSAQRININNDVALLKSVIKRKLRKTTKEGIEMMYVDDNGDTKDTVRVLIPSDKMKEKDVEIKSEPVVSLQATLQDDKKKEKDVEIKTDPKIFEKGNEINKETNKQPIITSKMINSDCKNFATDEDFLKIRKRMVAENNDEDMIRVAKKYFKTKCFITEQIKNLSVLFLKDEGKYMFFDAAYPFASDSDLYYTLEKQLADNYYITRFRAMIHK